MAEFSEVVKQWRRMCKYYSDKGMKAEQLSCVDTCPLGHNTVCGIIKDALDSDIETMVKEVAKWTAEHPEPVYPTWGEWLEEMGIMADIHDRPNKNKQVLEVCGKPLYSIPTAKVLYPIPADIAKKLGIKPKEDT